MRFSVIILRANYVTYALSVSDLFRCILLRFASSKAISVSENRDARQLTREERTFPLFYHTFTSDIFKRIVFIIADHSMGYFVVVLYGTREWRILPIDNNLACCQLDHAHDIVVCILFAIYVHLYARGIWLTHYFFIRYVFRESKMERYVAIM